MTATAPGTRSLAAMRQVNVTLTLTAKITPGAAIETVWGLLPGSGPDHERGLIVNTHTPTPEHTEENGALGMLALARYFAKRERRRDLYFVMRRGISSFHSSLGKSRTGSSSATTRSAGGCTIIPRSTPMRSPA